MVHENRKTANSFEFKNLYTYTQSVGSYIGTVHKLLCIGNLFGKVKTNSAGRIVPGNVAIPVKKIYRVTENTFSRRLSSPVATDRLSKKRNRRHYNILLFGICDFGFTKVA